MNQIANAKKQTQPYEVFSLLWQLATIQELLLLKEIAEKNCKDERFTTISFVVIEAIMGDKEYERFIEYQANAQCAQSHGLPQQYQTYTKQAAEMITAMG